MKAAPTLDSVHHRIVLCDSCPRLREYCQEIARVKRRAYLDQEYWGKPITGFGDARARLLIVGLAPAAHGANRTGRIFTGDRSGEWLYRALHKAGFANQPHSVGPGDGLELRDAYISCVVKCAPPDNKPLPDELQECSRHLHAELQMMPQARVFLVLGQIALQGLWPFIAPTIGGNGAKRKLMTRPKFGHGERFQLPDGRWLLMSYHPSQQNTFTGRLTEPMFDSVFAAARELVRG